MKYIYMSSQILPQSLSYGVKDIAGVSRSTTVNIQPQGSLSGYTGNSTCSINMPTGHNSVLCSAESVLKFNLAIDASANARWDSCGAHGLIQRIRVYHGSNLLEDLDSYNLFAKEMFDLQVSNDSISGKYSILAGTRADLYGSDSVNLNSNTVVKNMNTGAIIKPGATGNDYCITLLSVLGSLSSSKYFPLFACTSAPIKLEITFVSNLYGCACVEGTNAGFTVNNIEYLASIMELSDSAIQAISSSIDNAGRLSYNIIGVKNYMDTARFSAGTTQKSFSIAARYASVKSIIVSMRDTNKVNIANYYPFGTYKYGLEEYKFRIGTINSIPGIAPKTVPNFFYELLKCVNNVSNVHHQPAIDFDSYNMDTAVPATTANMIKDGVLQSGSFYIGLNTETFPNSDNTTFYTGTNTLLDDIQCMITNKAGAELPNIRLDAFVSFDQIISFENGTAFTAF